MDICVEIFKLVIAILLAPYLEQHVIKLAVNVDVRIMYLDVDVIDVCLEHTDLAYQMDAEVRMKLCK